MENIKNTTKYIKVIKIILIIIAFTMLLPIRSVLAQENTSNAGGSNNTSDAGGSNNTSDAGGSNNTSNAGGSNNTSDAGGSNNTSNAGGSNQPSNQASGGISFISYSTGYMNQPSNQTSGITFYNYGTTYADQPSNQTSDGINFITYSTNYPNQPSNQTAGYNTYQTYYYPQPTYYTQSVPVQNQVLSYTDTNPSLDSVYLSDVPYTGLADSLPMIIFILSLTLWSGILAYVFLKRKIASQTVLVGAYVNNETKKENKINHSVTSGFMNQIVSDNSDINKVEGYARMNKVLLSSDASAKIVKLVRLGKINASEYIRSIATGEWKAIGEGDIK